MNFTNWSDIELLKILLGQREAKKLYQGSLGPLFACGEATKENERLLVARELVKRWLNEEIKRGPTLAQPSRVREFLIMYFMRLEHEVFIGLFLDAQNRVIEVEEMFRGTLTQTSVYPREVVKRALRHNAAAMIFAHNHPSGVAEPSRSDESLTQALKQALALVDVKVLDHFVVGGSAIMSFAERGLI